MIGKYRAQSDKPKYPHSETSRFLTGIANSQWILARQGQAWRPPTDVFETDDSIVVKVEVAGMAEDDFAITFADRNLIITGVRRDPSDKLGYHQMEIPFGEFRTDVYVSKAIDIDGIEASYENGFLLVSLPKEGSHRVSISRE